MRLFHLLPILSFLFGTGASSLDSRMPGAHPLDARDVPNMCAYINMDLEILNHVSKKIENVGAINTCLCLSDVSQFVATNPVAINAVTAAGTGGVQDITDLITNLITTNSPETCNYPEISVPACVGDNPCGFTCLNGYTASPPSNPTTCVCPAPNVVCNGNCVASGACPSSQATRKRRLLGSGSCTEKGPGWAACGVFGGGTRAWECVNTAHDLESCGGCALPLMPFSPIGEDCTALPGIADVSCLSGECVVRRCMPGYVLSRDQTHCVSMQTHTSQPHVSVPEDEEEYMQAIRYGLEHRSL